MSQRDHLRKLIGVSYGLASDYVILKDSRELNQNEKSLLKTVGELALTEANDEDTADDEFKIQVFDSQCFLGSFSYSEIFGDRAVITQGTVVELKGRDYAVQGISLTSDKQIKMDVFGRVHLL